ncbi:helix-turn-helix transcriptional regulator [Bosea vestrisii]|uniref:helix-turn-helix transcriptional regulator n=1 Tax=Bosea vestrisii TaxID=151416 RepID=UPI0024DF95D0|nr:helix-turn-helix transcriptional regulator [Bosea vestrisii]WID96222.1 helix-turn-helix transcriptional regulator [Bosea vestrisii]
MTQDLVERIYEAAFVPEKWSAVLTMASGLSGSASGSICVLSDTAPIRGRLSFASSDHGEALEGVRRIFDEFVNGDHWQFPGVLRMYTLQPARFVHVEAFMTPEDIERDTQRLRLRALGIGAHLCAAVPMPSGELVTYVFQRWNEAGGYGQSEIDRLDGLRPHLARAGLVAARLGLERAHTTVSALQAMGLPAAVLTSAGRALAVNALMEAMASIFRPAALGRMAIADAKANRLFQEAVAAARSEIEPAARSIPVPAKDQQPALIVHLIPLRRSATDIFSGADTLVVATAVSASAAVPSPSILSGLFDLTPAEAKLATALAGGSSLEAAAAESGVRMTTARTHLDRIFRKTGTSRQGQLVALLKGTQLL